MNKNLTVEQVYVAFRMAQARAKNRPYRLPKDFDKHLNEKFSPANRNSLLKVTDNFNTKWMNIDPLMFFECGFDLYKSFSYTKFFNEKVMELYIQRDKHLKRDKKFTIKGFQESLKFVMKYIRDNDIRSINIYCLCKKNNVLIPVKHYLENKIDKFFMVWLISKGIINLSDDERAVMPYIVEKYREIRSQLDDAKEEIKQMEKSIW